MICLLYEHNTVMLVIIVFLFQIALTISDFQLESSIMCMYDYLTLFMDGTQRGPFCGDRTIPVLYSKGNSMVLVFNSDKSTQAKGFQVSYTFCK